MAQLSVIAKLTAKAGRRDELVDKLRALVAVTESEPGTLVYSLSVSSSEPDVIWFFELYPDQEALAAHSGSEGMKAAGAAMGDLLGGAPELHLCELVVAKGLPG